MPVVDALAEQAATLGMPLPRYVGALLTEAARRGPRPALRWAGNAERPDPDGPDDGSGGASQPGGDAVVVSLARARMRRARARPAYPPASARGPDTG